MTHHVLSIGGLAEATATSTETIRYYERIGLMPPPGRTEANYRSYGAIHLARLSFIKRARDLGFTLQQVKALLSLAENRNSDCCEVDAIAKDHLATVEAKLADLRALRRELRDLISQCQQGVIAECRIIGALSPL